ncbi:MAG TPA: GNAT family N-acetyltransferase [Planctomycetota bacterium]|nr:GNAT family N-acetyltransferase [Planctomycetota bacterium]
MPEQPHIRIAPPRDEPDWRAARDLLVDYSESLGFSLTYQGFEAEVSSFPGEYAAPAGALLLAVVDATAAGIVALRRLEPDVCEMKRLFVRPEFRGVRTTDGLSLGRALASEVVNRARELGYRRMRLDTIAGKMDAAIALYRSMGFVEIAPYCDSPVPGTLFMEKRL